MRPPNAPHERCQLPLVGALGFEVADPSVDYHPSIKRSMRQLGQAACPPSRSTSARNANDRSSTDLSRISEVEPHPGRPRRLAAISSAVRPDHTADRRSCRLNDWAPEPSNGVRSKAKRDLLCVVPPKFTMRQPQYLPELLIVRACRSRWPFLRLTLRMSDDKTCRSSMLDVICYLIHGWVIL